MNRYTKARIKVLVITIFATLGIILAMWLGLFVTDYIMYKNDRPMLFAETRVEDINGKRVIVEQGIGYYIITNDQNVAELYLFGHKIK